MNLYENQISCVTESPCGSRPTLGLERDGDPGGPLSPPALPTPCCGGLLGTWEGLSMGTGW